MRPKYLSVLPVLIGCLVLSGAASADSHSEVQVNCSGETPIWLKAPINVEGVGDYIADIHEDVFSSDRYGDPSLTTVDEKRQLRKRLIEEYVDEWAETRRKGFARVTCSDQRVPHTCTKGNSGGTKKCHLKILPPTGMHFGGAQQSVAGGPLTTPGNFCGGWTFTLRKSSKGKIEGYALAQAIRYSDRWVEQFIYTQFERVVKYLEGATQRYFFREEVLGALQESLSSAEPCRPPR